MNVETVSSNGKLGDDGTERMVLESFPVERIKPIVIVNQSDDRVGSLRQALTLILDANKDEIRSLKTDSSGYFV